MGGKERGIGPQLFPEEAYVKSSTISRKRRQSLKKTCFCMLKSLCNNPTSGISNHGQGRYQTNAIIYSQAAPSLGRYIHYEDVPIYTR